MPTITPVPFNPSAISMSVERDALRSPGIHLSSIIKDMLVAAGIGRQMKGRPLTKSEQHLIFQRGFLWERMVSEYLESEEWIKRQQDELASKHMAIGVAEVSPMSAIRLVRPGECILDGIYMTPDALNMTDYCVEEWKATAIRAKGFSIEDRRPEWLWQAGSYAHVFGMTEAIIRIWHVSDNIIQGHKIVWTPEEIRDNWSRIRDHWDHMQDRKKVIGDAVRPAGSATTS